MHERLEGRTSILAAIRAGRRRIETILLSPTANLEKLEEVVAEARHRGIPIRNVEEEELGAQAKSHGGIVALCDPKPLLSRSDLLALPGKLRDPVRGQAQGLPLRPLFLLLDGVDDPRDLGMILRTAESFGVHAVLLRRRAWDIDSTALSRGSSGAFERLPVALVEREMTEIAALRKGGLQLIGCMPNGRHSLFDIDLSQPLILAVGGEKRGLSNIVRSRCDSTLRIPTVGEATSLSSVHAAAIILAETFRRRTHPPSGADR